MENDELIKSEETSQQEAVSQEQETVEMQNTGKGSADKLLTVATVILCLTLQLFAFVLYLAGALRIFDKNATVVAVIESIIELFDFNSAVAYRCIMSVILSALYIGFLPKFIKDIVTSVRATARLFGKKEYKDETTFVDVQSLKNRRVYRITKNAFMAFELVCIYDILSQLVHAYEIGGAMIALFVYGALVFVVRGFYQRRNSSASKSALVLKTLKDAVSFGCICMFIGFMHQSSFETFIDGMSMLFRGAMFVKEYTAQGIFYLLYSYVLGPLLFMVLMIPLLFAIHNFIGISLRGKQIYKPLFTGVGFALILMLATLIFEVMLTGKGVSFDAETLSSWFTLIRKGILPLTLFLGAWALNEFLFFEKAKEEKA